MPLGCPAWLSPWGTVGWLQPRAGGAPWGRDVGTGPRHRTSPHCRPTQHAGLPPPPPPPHPTPGAAGLLLGPAESVALGAPGWGAQAPDATGPQPPAQGPAQPTPWDPSERSRSTDRHMGEHRSLQSQPRRGTPHTPACPVCETGALVPGSKFCGAAAGTPAPPTRRGLPTARAGPGAPGQPRQDGAGQDRPPGPAWGGLRGERAWTLPWGQGRPLAGRCGGRGAGRGPGPRAGGRGCSALPAPLRPGGGGTGHPILQRRPSRDGQTDSAGEPRSQCWGGLIPPQSLPEHPGPGGIGAEPPPAATCRPGAAPPRHPTPSRHATRRRATRRRATRRPPGSGRHGGGGWLTLLRPKGSVSSRGTP